MLKQTPWAWFYELSSKLINYNFTNAKNGPSLFIFWHKATIIYFLAYVNNLLIIGNKIYHNNSSFLLPWWVLFTQSSAHLIFLWHQSGDICCQSLSSQACYIWMILNRTKMELAKLISIPMVLKDPFNMQDRYKPTDVTQYCQTTGVLQYLSLTRSDISYIVNHLAIVCSSPHNYISKRLIDCTYTWRKPSIMVFYCTIKVSFSFLATQMLVGLVTLMT